MIVGGKKYCARNHRKLGFLGSAVHRKICFKNGVLLLNLSCVVSSGYLRANYFSLALQVGDYFNFFH